LDTKPKSFNVLQGDQKIRFQLIRDYAFSNCTACHSGHEEPNLLDKQEVIKHKNDIWRAIDSQKMPPKGSAYKISQCQKDLIKKWIDMDAPDESEIFATTIESCKKEFDAGKPDTGNNPGTTPPPQEVPILLMPMNYKSLADRILKPKCLQCHTEGGDASDYLFYPYENLMQIERLWKSPAIESKVYRSFSDEGDPKPQKESKIKPLTDNEKEFVRRWIDAGKPEK